MSDCTSAIYRTSRAPLFLSRLPYYASVVWWGTATTLPTYFPFRRHFDFAALVYIF
jgi:hypothetical protein